LSRKSLAELRETGLLAPIPGSNVYPAESATVAIEAKRLMDHGLEARHLRTVKLGVGREADLLTQLTAPLLKATNPEARGRAREILEDCAESVRVMHRSLLAQELRRHLS
jgi:hypothetical protein